jgi:hypothetical protein
MSYFTKLPLTDFSPSPLVKIKLHFKNISYIIWNSSSIFVVCWCIPLQTFPLSLPSASETNTEEKRRQSLASEQVRILLHAKANAIGQLRDSFLTVWLAAVTYTCTKSPSSLAFALPKSQALCRWSGGRSLIS